MIFQKRIASFTMTFTNSLAMTSLSMNDSLPMIPICNLDKIKNKYCEIY